ncbi:MAG: hypothetical protein CM1200mP14_22130 [Gammaproteobacteria bacterium]|nr:MAG: hypothetical protein CM1200mP14_22130 [Gammaproteobacteria bacterium]
MIADLCLKYDILAITDEIYEHIYYEGEHTFCYLRWNAGSDHNHKRPLKDLQRDWMAHRTIIAPPDLTDAIRKVHDFLTVGAPAPLQEACAVGIRELGSSYYEGLTVIIGNDATSFSRHSKIPGSSLVHQKARIMCSLTLVLSPQRTIRHF